MSDNAQTLQKIQNFGMILQLVITHAFVLHPRHMLFKFEILMLIYIVDKLNYYS
jgi:hypothetical protein